MCNHRRCKMKKYLKPAAEVILFAVSDVMTGSGEAFDGEEDLFAAWKDL